MKKIIGILRPFDLEQQFYVYEDGNKIDSAELTIDEVPNKIIEFASKYEVNQIDLTGPKQYSKGISQKIREVELAKYNKNTFEINLI